MTKNKDSTNKKKKKPVVPKTKENKTDYIRLLKLFEEDKITIHEIKVLCNYLDSLVDTLEDSSLQYKLQLKQLKRLGKAMDSEAFDLEDVEMAASELKWQKKTFEKIHKTLKKVL